MPELRIVADEHIWQAGTAFAHFPGYETSLQTVAADAITPEIVRDADVLLVRSSTKVDAALLAGSSVRFVATATIGFDHVDTEWLRRQGIAFSTAAGSSTDAVLEYMTTVLLHLHHCGRMNLDRDTLGVIGVGRIGGGLLPRCQALGLKTLCNDPPRASSEPDVPFHALDELLRTADVLTLHTPLTRAGRYPSFHLLDAAALAAFQGKGIINAGRGACVDNTALLDWLNASPDRWAVLDCWEHEPQVMMELVRHPGVVIATPHIAGHSLDGKAANTEYVYRDLCTFLGVTASWQASTFLPAARKPLYSKNSDDMYEVLYDMAITDYPVINDHRAMKTWASGKRDCFAAAFRAYRRHYPVRRGWHACPWRVAHENWHAVIKVLGFALPIKPLIFNG